MKKVLCAVLFLALVVPTFAFAADLPGDAVYKKSCAMCHGANGEGKAAMKTKPLKDAASKSEADLTKTINDGIPGTTMKGYKDKLKPEEVKAIAAEIKALK